MVEGPKGVSRSRRSFWALCPARRKRLRHESLRPLRDRLRPRRPAGGDPGLEARQTRLRHREAPRRRRVSPSTPAPSHPRRCARRSSTPATGVVACPTMDGLRPRPRNTLRQSQTLLRPGHRQRDRHRSTPLRCPTASTSSDGTGSFADPHTITITTENDESNRSRPSSSLISVGTRPAAPKGLEFDGKTILSSDDVPNLTAAPHSMIVVGRRGHRFRVRVDAAGARRQGHAHRGAQPAARFR